MKFKIIRRNGTLIFKKAFFHSDTPPFSDTRKKKKWSFFKKVITFSGGFTGKKIWCIRHFCVTYRFIVFLQEKDTLFYLQLKIAVFYWNLMKTDLSFIFGKNRNSKGQYDERKKSKIIFLSLVLVIHGHTVILYSFGWCSLKNE